MVDQMPRSNAVTPDDRTDVLDYVADYGHDAVDAGVPPAAVASALREAAREIDEHDDSPARAEPADFGGGDSTGVQDL
jgi:hypothetical protein